MRRAGSMDDVRRNAVLFAHRDVLTTSTFRFRRRGGEKSCGGAPSVNRCRWLRNPASLVPACRGTDTAGCTRPRISKASASRYPLRISGSDPYNPSYQSPAPSYPAVSGIPPTYIIKSCGGTNHDFPRQTWRRELVPCASALRNGWMKKSCEPVRPP